MMEQWNVKGLEEHLHQEFNVDIPLRKMLDDDLNMQEAALRNHVIKVLEQSHKDKEEHITQEVMQHFEKSVMLQVLDNSWKEHLSAMDYLRQGIHFRGYAQKDPKQEYKREAFEMFTSLLEHIKYEVIGILFKVQVKQEADVQAIDQQMQAPREMHFDHAAAPALDVFDQQAELADQEKQPEQPFIREGAKVGRNDPCPCGSGKKFKQCHGKIS
jgi:preprotein translocase subunit SecA